MTALTKYFVLFYFFRSYVRSRSSFTTLRRNSTSRREKWVRLQLQNRELYDRWFKLMIFTQYMHMHVVCNDTFWIVMLRRVPSVGRFSRFTVRYVTKRVIQLFDNCIVIMRRWLTDSHVVYTFISTGWGKSQNWSQNYINVTSELHTNSIDRNIDMHLAAFAFLSRAYYNNGWKPPQHTWVRLYSIQSLWFDCSNLSSNIGSMPTFIYVYYNFRWVPARCCERLPRAILLNAERRGHLQQLLL